MKVSLQNSRFMKLTGSQIRVGKNSETGEMEVNDGEAEDEGIGKKGEHFITAEQSYLTPDQVIITFNCLMSSPLAEMLVICHRLAAKSERNTDQC